MRIRTVRWSVALALVAAGTSPVRADDPVTAIDLAAYPRGKDDRPRTGVAGAIAAAARAAAADAVEAAVDPDTGGLAVVVPRQGRVVLYPKFVAGVGKGVKPVVAVVGGFPAGIAYKKVGDRAYFAVVSHVGRELVLLDAVTLRREKTIALGLGRPLSVSSSSSPKDPLVYYTARAGEPPRAGTAFGWVNLNTAADETPKGGVAADDLAVTPDGIRLFARQTRSLYTFDAFDAPSPDRPGVVPVRKRGGAADGPGLVTDPRGEFVAAGSRLWSLREGREEARLPVPVAFASPTLPVLLGFDTEYKRLEAVSTNSLRVVGSVGLTLAPGERRAGKEVEVREADGVTVAAPRVQVLEDPTTRTVLVAAGRTVRVIPYAAFKLPDEPALALTLGAPLEFPVGRKHQIEVTPAAAGVAVELTAGPTGMTLDAGFLTWTPGESAVGLHPVSLRLSAKGAARTVSLTAAARRPSLTLPFVPAEYGDPTDPGFRSDLPRRARHLTADGSAAVFLGLGGAEGRNPPVNRVAVIDLVKLRVEAERTLPVGLTTAALDGERVYAGLAGSEAVKVLAREDLSDRGVVHTAGRPADLLPLPGDSLLVTSWGRDRPDRYRTEAFDAAGLKPKPPPGPPRIGVTVAPVAVGWGWWHDGVVYDAGLGKVRAVVAPRGFWVWDPKAKALRTDPPAESPLWSPTLGESRWFTPWGASLLNSQLLVGGKRVGYVPASAAPPAPGRTHALTVVLPDHPAAACLTLVRRPGRDGRPVVRAEVTFHDLSAAGAGAAVVLDERAADPDPHARPLDRTPLLLDPCPGGRLVAVVGRELFVVRIPALDPDAFPAPLHLPPDFPVTVVSADEVAVPLRAAGGGKGPVFSLADEVTGVRIDERAGKLVIAPRELVAALSDRVSKAGPAKVKDYLAGAGPRFERLTGKKPSGVPVWVPVSVIARDRLLGKAEGQFGFFVDVPAEGARVPPGMKR